MTLRARRRARLVAAVAVLVAVLWQTGHEPFVAGVRSLHPQSLLLGMGLAVPATLASAWRWQAVAGALGAPVTMRRAFTACYAAQLLNSTLPGGIAGDVARGMGHTPSDERLVGLRSVVWERFGGQSVQVAATGGALLLLPAGIAAPEPAWVVVGLVTLALVAGWASRARVVRQDLRRLLDPRVGAVVIVSSLVAQTCYVATGLVAARAVGVTASLGQLVPLILLVLVAMAVPLGVAGWGPREGVAAWSFAAAGLGAGAGVATAVAYGVIVVAASLPGLLAVGVLARRTVAPVTPAPGGVHA